MASKIPANSSLPGVNKQSGKNMGFEVNRHNSNAESL